MPLQSPHPSPYYPGVKRSDPGDKPGAVEEILHQGVPKGRLNLAQDVVLRRDSRDEKSRRDDWKLPGGGPRALPSQNIPRLRVPNPHLESRTMSITFSVVPVRQGQGRLCGTFQSRMPTQDCVLG